MAPSARRRQRPYRGLGAVPQAFAVARLFAVRTFRMGRDHGDGARAAYGAARIPQRRTAAGCRRAAGRRRGGWRTDVESRRRARRRVASADGGFDRRAGAANPRAPRRTRAAAGVHPRGRHVGGRTRARRRAARRESSAFDRQRRNGLLISKEPDARAYERAWEQTAWRITFT